MPDQVHRRTDTKGIAVRPSALTGVRRRLSLAAGCGLATATAVALASLPQAQASQAVAFVPHRAVYDITLARAATGSGIAELTGRMVYQLSGGACSGYTQQMRFVTRIRDQEGGLQVNDLRTSSWEADQGKRLKFSLDQYHNDELAEAIAGDAGRQGANGARVQVKLQKPDNKSLTLKPGVVFPMQHSKGLMRAAQSGRRVHSAQLFDGSEKGERVYFTSAIIGDSLRGAALGPRFVSGPGRALSDVQGWPISIGYFDPTSGDGDDLPSYELSFVFFENGVSSRLRIDYGEFAVNGELVALDMLPQPPCAEDE